MRACGLNTVATYCPWNLHEPEPGKFDFSGILDLAKFVKLADELGLKVMLRPGPYICSEWDFGGFPAWLYNMPGMRLRSLNAPYMERVASYLFRILKEAEPYYCNNGGPIIAVQIENGYASFGNDVRYLTRLKEIVEDSGFKGIIYTSDGDSDTRINAESPEGVWRTLMTGTKLEEGLRIMNEVQPNMPQMISEWWVGQGLRLGKPMRHRDIQSMAKELDALLSKGAHISCYMFHGGTNFGFMSGALRNPPQFQYTPFVSSYDVDAMLNEAGDITPKYKLFREVFLKYNPGAANFSIPPDTSKKAFGKVSFTRFAGLADNLENLSEKTVYSPYTLTMEDLGQAYGFIHYSTHMKPQSFPLPVRIDGLRDRAWLALDGKLLGVFSQNGENPECVLNIPKNGAQLDILVENMGRLNFGLTIEDNRKGITKGLILNKGQQYQNGWTIKSIPLKSLEKIDWKKAEHENLDLRYPAFFSGEIKIDEPCDTYLKISGARGYCWINGFLVGRYESAGPVLTTFVPAPLLKKGENKVEILELENLSDLSAEFVDKPTMVFRQK